MVEKDIVDDILKIDVDFDLDTKKMRKLIKKGIAKPGVVDGDKGFFIDKQWLLDQGIIEVWWDAEVGYHKKTSEK